ncbi:oligosaccharide flippase family protein [Enterococcus faecium]|uniref:oligosaccharide flippase family protein n=3 Tax=Bacteria TaxID=2 RepID=UPI000CFE2CE2|nr:oligosaccharide flippase family protein [Enterococcus faecium]MCD5043052.1 oligosaccharide flippase family protein [Enterococcus faecium]MCV3115646.1 oligosaccharide flippase family protein [Enterococcus faecium]MDT2272166.1 oligosaccharide flippase family protein [Enterococcus faecium]MDT2407333.1 oligosaccharide flippase family protein [Enterococcus faecium]PQV96526.1 hypothetical protein CWC50_10580 [Enterococcus faecium]
MKNKIAKNTLFLYILTFSNYFLGLMLFPYLSRVLSVEKFGLVGFSMSFVLIFQMIVEYGFSISGTAQIAKYQSDFGKINEAVTIVTFAKIFLSIISLFLFLFSAVFIKMIRENFLFVGLFILDSFIKALLPDFYFRGIEEMKTITIRAVIAKSLCIGLVLFLVSGDQQVNLVPLSYIIGDLAALIITVIMMFKKGVKFTSLSIKSIIEILREGFPYFLSRVSVSINNSIGTFFLGLKFSPSSIETGILSGITKITTAGDMLLTPVNDSIYPHMVRNKDYKFLKKIIIFGGIIWFLGCTVIFVFADFVCSLVLGPNYAEAGIYLRILVVNTFFGFFSLFLGYPALSPIGKANYANAALPFATIVNLVCYFILWATNNITLLNVVIVMSVVNLLMAIFRGIALYRNRYLISKKLGD